LGSQYPTRYPAAGNEGVLDAALTYQTFFYVQDQVADREPSYIMEQYTDCEWFQTHASYVIPAIIQIILGEEIFKEARQFTAYVLVHNRWLRLKKHFSYNNDLRDTSFVNYLKFLSESLTEILHGEFL
jgi:hypothetical protein